MLHFLEGICFGNFQGGRQSRNGVHVRTALFAGEHCPVELSTEGCIGGQRNRAARTQEGFMSGEGDHVGMTDWRRNCSGSD